MSLKRKQEQIDLTQDDDFKIVETASKPRSRKEECLETFDLADLYIWFKAPEQYPTHLCYDRKGFVEAFKEETLDLTLVYIVRVNQNSPHFVVVHFISATKITIYDTLKTKLTGPLVGQLRKIRKTQVESVSLRWQDNDWECGFFCLWLVLMLESESLVKNKWKMPPIFGLICTAKLQNPSKVVDSWGQKCTKAMNEATNVDVLSETLAAIFQKLQV